MNIKLFESIKIYIFGTKTRIIITFLVTIVVIIAIIIWTHNDQIDEEEPFSETTCICVFDIDGTLTCGYEQARGAIEECKKRNCKIAINTARPVPYIADLKFDRLGLKRDDVNRDVYYGDWVSGLVSSVTPKRLGSLIAETKVKHLRTLEEKYKVKPRKRIILFDDVYQNITEAEKHGFSVIHANYPSCGLNQYVRSEISEILDS